MAHHAYFVTGERERAVASARAFVEQEYGQGSATLDIRSLSFELFSVDGARRLVTAASTSGTGDTKVIIASMTRIFHEAQNALLKILEEPPAGALIILCVPSEGVFIETLRSRMLPLPYVSGFEVTTAPEGIAERFLNASTTEREKIVSKLVDQSKSDKDETKQQARREAIELIQGLIMAAHEKAPATVPPSLRKELLAFLEDLTLFMPILYERSAPLKLIFEHILLTIPTALGKDRV